MTMIRKKRIPTRRRSTAALIVAALAAATLAAIPAQEATAAGPKTRAGASAPAPQRLSADQAAERAHTTGKPVVASALTTSTSQTTANPDGTFTLAQSAAPARVLQPGTWTDLDPALTTNTDGTLSPKAALGSVTLSGGGTGPLVSLHTGGQGFTLTLPLSLPRPTVTGSSAEYLGVLPGVDLTVTVEASGAVSDVFTLHNAVAARDPRLADLLHAQVVPTRGLHLTADAGGDIAFADASGHPVYTAPAPLAWDSAAAPVPSKLAERPGATALKSSTRARGAAAHTSRLKVTVARGKLSLGLPGNLLSSDDTVYPVYVDPTYSPSYGNTGWSSPGSGLPTESYWKSSVSFTGDAEIGNSGDVQGEAMSLFDFPISSTLHGAKIYSAHFDVTETWSWACLTSGHNQIVDLYAPSKVLTSSNATWSDWSGSLGSSVDSHSFALGYDSSCPAGGAPPFDVTSTVANDVSSGKSTQTLAMRAADHTDNYALKRFNPKTAQLVVTYDKYPNTPKGLFTNPATNCSGVTVGETAVTLYVPVSTPTGASLTTTFNLYKTSDSSKTNLLTAANGVASDTYHGASGQLAVLPVPESLFSTAAGGTDTSFTWHAQTSDGTLTSNWSATCSFSWDASRPGQPGVIPNSSPPAGTYECPTLDAAGGAEQPLGNTCSFTVTPPTGGGTISGYEYQLNQSAPITVEATGSTTINVPVSRLVNTLTVNALSPGGNSGLRPAFALFLGTGITPPAKDGDIDLDGTPDLITVGGPDTGLPSGLWLSDGHPDGTVREAATNIGVNGLQLDDVSSTAPPTDWDGAQAITGNFCGNGAQDIFAYFPSEGGGDIVCNDGSSDPLEPSAPTTIGTSSPTYEVTGGSLTGDDGQGAAQVVPAGNTSGQNEGLPDLLVIADNQLILAYSTTPGGYSTAAGDFGTCDHCNVLSALNTPDGTPDWGNWTIATAQLASGTAMYLWNRSTGELDLWTGLALSADGTTLTTTGAFHLAANGWHQNPSDTLVLRAADFAGAGIPSLWVTDLTTQAITSYTPSALADGAALTTTTTNLLTANHSWQFEDIGGNNDGSVFTSSADSAGSLPLDAVTTGTPSATWNTGGVFSPDVLLDGTATSDLHADAALALNGSFTVSVWADPTAYGGAVVSQDSSAYSGFKIVASTDGWQFGLNTGNGSGNTFTTITGGTTQLNTWTHLTATYDQQLKVMNLYVNDTYVATGKLTNSLAVASGPFQVGSDDVNSVRSDHYSGQVADLRTWTNQVLPPAQPTTPGGYHQAITPTRILDTRTSGGLVHASHNIAAGTSTVPGGSVIQLQVAGDAVTPAVSGAPTTVPTTVTAVSIDVTATNETNHGYVAVYADGAQQPLTSSTNFAAGENTTGYQIVPVGGDGKIDLYTHGDTTDTIALIVDLTGYFTSDSTAAGDQTYTPLNSPARALDTRVSTANTTGLAGIGTVPANTTFTLKIADTTLGDPAENVPSNATAVAVNLTAADEVGGGHLAAYATDTSPTLTSLSYNTDSSIASMSADVPIAADGTITIANYTNAAAVIVDVSGYYTTDTSGQKYHSVNATRLVDNRSGVGNVTMTPVSGGTAETYTLPAVDTQQITTVANPTLTTMITVTDTTSSGNAAVYAAELPIPSSSNPFSDLNWAIGATRANLALPRLSNGQFTVYVNGDSVSLIVDCTGFFA